MATTSLMQIEEYKQLIYQTEKSIAALRVATSELMNILYTLQIAEDAKQQATNPPVCSRKKQ
jgi:hypothetical protein